MKPSRRVARSRRRLARALAPCLAVIGISGAPAAAAVLDVEASLSIELLLPTAVPTSPSTPVRPLSAAFPGAASSIAVGPAGSFSLPSGVVSTSRSTPIGFTPNAVTNQVYFVSARFVGSSGSGSFAPTAGPLGGFGGFLSSGLDLDFQMGIVPLPMVFATVRVPLSPAGAGGTGMSANQVLANAVTVTVSGTGWTTQRVGLPLPPSGTSFLSASGFDHRTASGRGALSLVTPFVVNVTGAAILTLPGLARLDLVFTPEPRLAILVGIALVAGLVARGRR